MPQSNWAIFWSFLLALALMLALNYFFNWWLMPDLVLIVLLQWLLQERVGNIWRVVLPISLLMDLSGQTLLGFHGMTYALMAIFITPLPYFWSRASLLEQFILVVVMLVGYVVLRAIATYIITGIPAVVGWYWPIFTQILCWPLVFLFREAFVHKLLGSRRK